VSRIIDVHPDRDVAVELTAAVARHQNCSIACSPAGETMLRTTCLPLSAYGLTRSTPGQAVNVACASKRRSGQQPLWDGSCRRITADTVGASQLAVPLMLSRNRGSITNLSLTDGDTYLGRTTHSVCKSAFDLMALGMAAGPCIDSLSGQRFGKLVIRYDFTAIDDRQPPAFKTEERITLAARMERLNRVMAISPQGAVR